MFNSNKFHNMTCTLTCYTDSPPLMHSTAAVYKTNHIWHALHCSHPQLTQFTLHAPQHALHAHPALLTPLPSTTLLCTQLTQGTVGKMAQAVSIVVSLPSSLVGFWEFHPYMHLFSFWKLLYYYYIIIVITIIWNMPTGGTILKYKVLVVDYVLSNTVQELSNCTTICHTVYTNTLVPEHMLPLLLTFKLILLGANGTNPF